MPSQSAITRALARVLAESSGSALPLDADADRYILFSDHHKGRCDGAEEFWENRVEPVLEAYANVLASERRFFPDRYVKTWGNHDDEWETPRRVRKHLTALLGDVEVRESLHFRVRNGGSDLGSLLLLHGHQGTLFSDRLAGLAKLAVRFVWRTIQRLTRIPSTTPATDACLRDEHDHAMYRWAAQQTGLVLVAGHTHRPVFSSKTHLRQLLEELRQLQEDDRDDKDDGDDRRRHRIEELRAQIQHVREKTKECEKGVPKEEDRSRPCYFNTGCCCFADGDITGIELAEGELRLVKWGELDDAIGRKLLARASLERIFTTLASPPLITDD